MKQASALTITCTPIRFRTVDNKAVEVRDYANLSIDASIKQPCFSGEEYQPVALQWKLDKLNILHFIAGMHEGGSLKTIYHWQCHQQNRNPKLVNFNS